MASITSSTAACLIGGLTCSLLALLACAVGSGFPAADRSYGIHVGRLAGLPKRVLARAESLLKGLESGSVKGKVSSRRRQKLQKTARESIQLSLFEPVHVE